MRADSAQLKGAHAHHSPADHFQHLNDVCLVRASQVQGFALVDRGAGELGIAFFEYCFQVPANRIGHYEFNAAQLKTIQEVITLIVFCVFSVLYLKEPLKWNYLAGFGLMIGAVFLIFKEW